MRRASTSLSLALVALLGAGLVLCAPGSRPARAGEAPARADLERRLAALGEDATAAYRLGLELEAAGVRDLAARAFERVIEVEPDHLAARRALGYERVQGRWLAGDELMRAKGFLRHLGRWMSAEEFAEATRPEREAAEHRAAEERVLGWLAEIATEVPEKVARGRRQLALADPRAKLGPLAKALRCHPVSLRLYAAEELGRLGDPLGAPALLKRAIYDPDAGVRRAVARALRALGQPSAVHPLGRALDSRDEQVRVRAAEALAELGDELAYAYVIRKWEARSGDFPRVYFAQTRQISYIQDFDVEVAQTSFIADPIVGVLQEGVVQAVKVLATEQTLTTVERSAYHGALKQLAGVDLGDDVKAWRAFWDENGERLLAEREARHAAER